MRFLRHFLLALQFFTRIPVTGRLADWVGFSPAMLRASAAHFPGVGWLVGLAAALVYGGLLALLPRNPYAPLVAAVLSTAATALLTGGFHEDGLSDVADGLGGGSTREQALDIMKDSRVGAFGVLALALALLAKVALLALLGSLDAGVACAALLGAHVVSRFLPLGLIRLLPHVGDTARSKSKPLADQISTTSLLVASVWTLAALALLQWLHPGMHWAAAVAVAVGAALWLGWRLARRLQGYTGDGLGATQQVCEIAFYLGLGLAL